MGEIIRSGIPFLIATGFAMVTVLLIPKLALWLPNL